MIDPNLLLSNFRNACASKHFSVAILAAATLDEQLSSGGELPNDWQQRYRPGTDIVGYRSGGVNK